ncbi:MAG: AAA family ATPase [Chloroflexi bacterium]|nr:AAA family ATPase [Chloroflexota bacterium]
MKIRIENFRSIENQEVELAPITVVYGPNGSGKSSLLYSLLTLKKLVENPNQKMPAFFNYQFLNLGDLKDVMFDHDLERKLRLEISVSHNHGDLTYGTVLSSPSDGLMYLLPTSDARYFINEVSVTVSFPYPESQTAIIVAERNPESRTATIVAERMSPNEDRDITIDWTGFSANVKNADPAVQEEAIELVARLNSPIKKLQGAQFIPIHRGFTQPNHSLTNINTRMITNENEVASLLATEDYFYYSVSEYLEQIMGKQLNVRSHIGTGRFSLDAIDQKTRVATSLVNEGFGLNQLVHMLTLCLYKETQIALIEEPEIHLHPTAISRLARAFARMAKEEGKTLVISTHSEHLVIALLTQVVEGELSPDQLGFYLASKEGKATTFTRQEVTKEGQVEGGLASFMEAELEDLQKFFGVPAE